MPVSTRLPAICAVLAVSIVGATRSPVAQEAFCPPGYAAVADSVAAEFDTRQFVFMGRCGTLTAEARQKVSLDQWFMLGVIRERGSDDRAIARMGDPSQPFYAGTAKLAAAPPYPRDLSIARQQPLASVINAVVYLGSEPDRSMSHAVNLTPAQQAEVARRDLIKGDQKQLMQLRYGQRAEWFRTHPNDIPPRH